MQLHSKFWFLALFCISLERLDRIIFIPHQIIFMTCIIMSETFIKIVHRNTLKFQGKRSLWSGQKSVLQHSLFWRYANFSKLMRTGIHSWLVHFSLNFTALFECKTLKIFALRLTKNIGKVSEKNVAKHLKVFLKVAPTLVFWAWSTSWFKSRERELSSVFDKLLVTLCCKHQTNL